MPWVKKVSEDWHYKENPELKVGDKVFLSNAEKLVEEGKAVYIDDQGNEISRGEPTKCPICVFTTPNAYELADHIYKAHPLTRPEAPKEPTTAVREVLPGEVPTKKYKDMTPEEQKVWRIENLKKARESAKAKKEAEETKQALKTVIEHKNA